MKKDLVLKIIVFVFIFSTFCNGQSLNLGKLDTLQSSGLLKLPGDKPLWSTIRPSSIQISHFYLIMYSSDSIEYKLEIPIQELPSLMKLMDSVIRKNGINSKLIKINRNDRTNL